MMVVGYDESPYILQEFTTNLDALDATAESKFQRPGHRTLRRVAAIVTDAFRYWYREADVAERRYDSESKTKLDAIVATLQRENIVVYVLEAPDRTRNASRLEGPKPKKAIARLTEATGGRVFPLAESAKAAKLITEELRLNWFRAVYTPRGVDRLQDRNLLIIRHETSPTIRIRARSRAAAQIPEIPPAGKCNARESARHPNAEPTSVDADSVRHGSSEQWRREASWA
jgi:hypothetical protein